MTSPATPTADGTAPQPLPPLEAVRLRIGLTRPQFMALLTAGKAAIAAPPSLTTLEPATYYLERAREIEHAHDLFMADIRTLLDREYDDPEATVIIDGVPEPLISARQVARATGLGEFQLSALRHRGAIPTYPYRGRKLYRRGPLYQALAPGARIAHGAYQAILASVFVEYHRG